MRETYVSPFERRYASKEMLSVFSDEKKFKTWRKLWVILAETQKEMGLPITKEQIETLKAYEENINYEVAEAWEHKVRHDVMAHVHAYGEQAKEAMPIIHLGATSCYVGDNTDLILMYEGLEIVKKKIINIIYQLSMFAKRYKALPTLGFTHFQPAQLTTVGKRATLWIHDLYLDLQEIEALLKHKKLRGAKGTTGTQATFLYLFDGDYEKVKQLDQTIAKKMGFNDVFPVTGQTYSRKVDTSILNVLSQVAQSAAKFSNDLRLLQHLKEIEEPFEQTQIGSSAMAYKRNPMRSERITGLARLVICNSLNPALTASTQWFERTLDDSVNKRVAVAESFLAVDAILETYLNVASGLVVYPRVINQRLQQELPFMATEVILMEGVKRGGDRQILHEKIRKFAMEAGKRIKEEGKSNNLIESVLEDKAFRLEEKDVKDLLDPKKFTGCAPLQVETFLTTCIDPVLEKYGELLGISGNVNI